MVSNCHHPDLVLHSSSHAETTGYVQPDAAKLVAATTAPGRMSKSAQVPTTAPPPSTFPAPLVLPGDDLAYAPRESAQSMRAWIQLGSRNEVTSRRKTIYVATLHECNDVLLRRRLETWTRPQVEKKHALPVDQPSTDAVVAYLEAFYHGMPIKQLSPALKFTSWDASSSSGPRPHHSIGLATPQQVFRIRTRPCPDRLFRAQLNLTDLLDGCVAALPADAFALLLLTPHDLFEDADDDFCCGSAWCGGRVAVVSTARYHPALDAVQDVERAHAWPAAHCAKYVEACCAAEAGTPTMAGREKRAAKRRRVEVDQRVVRAAGDGPMRAAVRAYGSAPCMIGSTDPGVLAGVWLGRVCRTASHELGHCFGIAHCAYYACAMQGTACISEDARQPPYLCPVDLAKVLRATGADEVERYHALLEFCNTHKDVHLFAAFGAWIEAVLESTTRK